MIATTLYFCYLRQSTDESAPLKLCHSHSEAGTLTGIESGELVQAGVRLFNKPLRVVLKGVWPWRDRGTSEQQQTAE